jgi:MFS family permease
MSQTSSIWQLYLFFGVLIGIGIGGVFIPLISVIPRWFIKRRSLMTGIAVSGIGVGAIVIPPLARWLIDSCGWQMSYVIIGVICY